MPVTANANVVFYYVHLPREFEKIANFPRFNAGHHLKAWAYKCPRNRCQHLKFRADVAKYTEHALLPTNMWCPWKRWFHSRTYRIIVHLSPLGLSLGTSSIIRPFLAQVAWLHWHRHDQGRCVDTNGLDPSERGMASTTSRQDLHCNTPWVSPEAFFCWLI